MEFIRTMYKIFLLSLENNSVDKNLCNLSVFSVTVKILFSFFNIFKHVQLSYITILIEYVKQDSQFQRLIEKNHVSVCFIYRFN